MMEPIDRFFCRAGLICFECCSKCEVFGCCDMCVSFGQPEKCQKCARYYLSPDPPESDRNAATVEDATPERYQWLMGRFAKEE